MKTLEQVETLKHVLGTMRETIASGNLEGARRLNEQIVTVFLDGVFSEDRRALAQMRDILAAFRSEIRSDERTHDHAVVESLMEANVIFATIAARRRPEGIKVEIDREAAGARDVVLAHLKRTGATSTGVLAEAAGVRPETMSRLLTALKLEGLVTSRRAGRNVLSRLTPRGQKEVGMVTRRISIRVELAREAPRNDALLALTNDRFIGTALAGTQGFDWNIFDNDFDHAPNLPPVGVVASTDHGHQSRLVPDLTNRHTAEADNSYPQVRVMA